MRDKIEIKKMSQFFAYNYASTIYGNR